MVNKNTRQKVSVCRVPHTGHTAMVLFAGFVRHEPFAVYNTRQRVCHVYIVLFHVQQAHDKHIESRSDAYGVGCLPFSSLLSVRDMAKSPPHVD